MSSFLKSTASAPDYLDTTPTLRKKQHQHQLEQEKQEHSLQYHHHQYGRKSLLKSSKRLRHNNIEWSSSSPGRLLSSASTRRPQRSCTYSILVICIFISICILYFFNSSSIPLPSFFHRNTDDNNIFVSLVPKKVAAKWRGYLSQRFFDSSATFPKLYFPRHCPSSDSTSTTTNRVLMCAKPVPSFIFAGSEMSGSKYVFEQLRQHPQVAWTMDTSKTSASTPSASTRKKGSGMYSLDDDDRLGEQGSSAAFETYLSQFPFLTEHELNNIEKQQVVVGEHAPHYLYKSYSTARRIRETLPHVKLVFILRDPIDRAYTQFLHEKSTARWQQQTDTTATTTTSSSTLSFDALVDLELSILQKCGHTSTQSGWEGFVRCHEGSEIRATWNLTNSNESPYDALKVYDSLAKGMYYNALLPFLHEFPASQVYVTRTEDFINNPSSSFQKLARFLGIQEHFFSERNFYARMAGQQQQQQYGGYDDLSAMILQQQTSGGQHHRQASPSNNYRSHHHHHHQQQQRVPAMGMEEAEEQQQQDDQGILSAPASSFTPSSSKSSTGTTAPTATASASATSSYLHQYDTPALDLSIRYRLEKLFRPLNRRLMELFENEYDFYGWDYDVDRG